MARERNLENLKTEKEFLVTLKENCPINWGIYTPYDNIILKRNIFYNYDMLNKLFFVLFFLSINLTYSQDKGEDKSKQVDLEEFKLNTEKLRVYLMIELMTKELVNNGIKLNQKGGNDLVKAEILFSNFNDKYGKEFNNTIALALGTNIDSLIKIDINLKLWNQLSDLEKVATICHEVCHDVLNVKHIDGDRLNLMHPFFQPLNNNELQIMINKFIRDYKIGRVELFREGVFVHDMSKNNLPYIKKI